jgi:hypothetical protein
MFHYVIGPTSRKQSEWRSELDMDTSLYHDTWWPLHYAEKRVSVFLEDYSVRQIVSGLLQRGSSGVVVGYAWGPLGI